VCNFFQLGTYILLYAYTQTWANVNIPICGDFHQKSSKKHCNHNFFCTNNGCYVDQNRRSFFFFFNDIILKSKQWRQMCRRVLGLGLDQGHSERARQEVAGAGSGQFSFLLPNYSGQCCFIFLDTTYQNGSTDIYQMT
jgi:hypothetical protein